MTQESEQGKAKTVPPLDAAALAKAKNDERRVHLEAFRAAQAAKRAASLGRNVEQPATASSKALTGRVHSKQNSQQQDPNKQLSFRKSAPASPVSKPPLTTRAQKAAQISSGVPLVKPKALALSKCASTAEATSDTSKATSWMEAQQAFGFETPRPAVSKRPSQAGEPASASLGPGFGDDGDPNMGIRWQIQMERLRLQQWKTLNARVEVAMESQRQQAEEQIQRAAEAVVTLKEKLFLEKACQAKQQNARYAAEVLAAQMPRLELYSTMNEEHEASMQKIATAAAAALQQMPLVNGAICGASAENADAAQLCTALRNIHDLLNDLDPRLRPFISMCYLQAKSSMENTDGLSATATAAKDLMDVDGQLRTYLQSNVDLLRKLENEVLHAESLAVQLLQAQETRC